MVLCGKNRFNFRRGFSLDPSPSKEMKTQNLLVFLEPLSVFMMLTNCDFGRGVAVSVGYLHVYLSVERANDCAGGCEEQKKKEVIEPIAQPKTQSSSYRT